MLEQNLILIIFRPASKNVTFDRGYSKHRVTIERKKVRVTRFADTLNEAIAIKERILDFYEKHDRLPTHDEI